MQRFEGEIEGFYVGEPDAAGFTRASAKSKHYRLRIYRAVVRRVKLLDTPPPTTTEAPTPNDAGAAPPTEAPTPNDAGAPSPAPAPPPNAAAAPPPPLESEPLPPGMFAQDVVTDARLTPVRHGAGWFEGPIHDVRVADFCSTHHKPVSGRVYGRFVGRVTAHFELPPPPLPPRAEALLAELSAPEAEAPLETGLKQSDAAPPDAFDAANVSSTTSAPSAAAAALEPPLAPEPGAKPKPRHASQVPLLLLVAAFAIAIFALCKPSRAVIWLVFLLPTLLLRRILRGALAESTGTRAFGALSMLGQLACVGSLGVSFWATGCKDLAFLPVGGLVLGVFVTSVLPSNVPLLVNGAALGLVLTTWCSAVGKRCVEPKLAPAVEARPTVQDPGVPRTNADGSWPRRPPRAAPEPDKKP